MSSIIKDGHVFVTNPSTLEEIAKIKCSTSSEVEHLILESKSYKKWSVLTLKQRCYYIFIYVLRYILNFLKISKGLILLRQ